MAGVLMMRSVWIGLTSRVPPLPTSYSAPHLVPPVILLMLRIYNTTCYSFHRGMLLLLCCD